MSVIIYFETVSDLVYTPPTFPRSENQHSHITPHRCPPTYTFRWGYSRCCGLTTCNFPAAVWDDMRGRSVRWVWRCPSINLSPVGFLRAHLVPASFQLSVTPIQLRCPSTRQHVSFFLTLHVLASHNLLAVCRYRLAPVYFTSHKVAGSIGSILCDVDGRVSYIVLPPCIRWVHVPSPLHIDRSRIYPIRSAHPKTVNKYQHADWLMGDFTRIKVTSFAFSTRFVHPSTSQRRYLPMALCASLLDSPQGHTNHDRKRKRYILCCGIKREVMIGKQTICMS